MTTLSTADAYGEMFPAVDSYDISTETYNRRNRKYVVAEGDAGAYVKAAPHKSRRPPREPLRAKMTEPAARCYFV